MKYVDKTVFTQFIVTLSQCMLRIACSWHQTGNCAWDGPREPQHDKDCDAIIDAGHSGYCKCYGGEIGMKKGCEAGKYETCKAACAGTLS